MEKCNPFYPWSELQSFRLPQSVSQLIIHQIILVIQILANDPRSFGLSMKLLCFPGNFPLKNLGDVSFGEVTLTTAPFTFALLFLASGFA